MKPILNIVSAGMGAYGQYSGDSLDVIRSSRRVLTTKRIGDGLWDKFGNVEILDIDKIVLELECSTDDVTVLVSGDCGFYSLGSMLANRFESRYDVRNFSGISSMQYLLAKLNKPYSNVRALSLHGRTGNILSAVTYSEKLFVLTDRKNSVKSILEQLKNSGIGGLEITVGENLSDTDEKITTSENISTLYSQNYSDLSVMYIENSRCTDRNRRLRDSDFIRGKVPMTKENVRVVSVNRMEINSRDIVYDIGAGTGSVSIAAAFKAYDGLVYSVEKSSEAVELLEKNRTKFGAYNCEIIQGYAPDCIDALPSPNKAFIGGSSGNMDSIIKCLVEKNSKITLCINVIALESLSSVLACMNRYNFVDIDISCINCAEMEKIGGYSMMKAENPVYIISGRHE